MVGGSSESRLVRAFVLGEGVFIADGSILPAELPPIPAVGVKRHVKAINLAHRLGPRPLG